MNKGRSRENDPVIEIRKCIKALKLLIHVNDCRCANLNLPLATRKQWQKWNWKNKNTTAPYARFRIAAHLKCFLPSCSSCTFCTQNNNYIYLLLYIHLRSINTEWRMIHDFRIQILHQISIITKYPPFLYIHRHFNLHSTCSTVRTPKRRNNAFLWYLNCIHLHFALCKHIKTELWNGRNYWAYKKKCLLCCDLFCATFLKIAWT